MTPKLKCGMEALTASAFNPHAQRNAFRHRDARQPIQSIRPFESKGRHPAQTVITTIPSNSSEFSVQRSDTPSSDSRDGGIRLAFI
jgi:hypothetical protein